MLVKLISAICLLLVTSTAIADIIVHDDTSNEVRLASLATRIISLAPHATELLFAAGAGERVVGVANYSDYPAAALRLPKIGTSNSLDLETIAALHPDLIIAWKSGNPDAQLEKLRQLHIPIFYSEPQKISDIPSTIEHFGRLAGTESFSRTAATAFRNQLNKLRNNFSNRKPVSVFYQIWDHPLITINDQHFISDAISLCGGRNIFGKLPTLTPNVSTEAVLIANPEAIITSGIGESRPDWLNEWQRWPKLQATQHKTLFFIPADYINRPSPRILKGIEQMCTMIEQAREQQK
ncbi:cobalamin-binding protein [Sulfurirhabdus autotrophica]|uniref:Iron complex transport system substrate-binding protein n=1 Tax=Sulfurirhabdus autotrophica TaxID=1706046 RepID=A0A4R3Y214_9PROT|nr:cobalamin-binding protein [Sulfurirhabdus autotrophica]TCV84294.1 iron complex transport system substrate-binding protein [Sulfurirhabdus autotrophica]